MQPVCSAIKGALELKRSHDHRRKCLRSHVVESRRSLHHRRCFSTGALIIIIIFVVARCSSTAKTAPTASRSAISKRRKPLTADERKSRGST